ncbi:hypothetical protein G6F63_016742 [Rhizopus arrhizus]|nr:hypothetical protein G6F63_016742 [Rhizopus arrhizus]
MIPCRPSSRFIPATAQLKAALSWALSSASIASIDCRYCCWVPFVTIFLSVGPLQAASSADAARISVALLLAAVMKRYGCSLMRPPVNEEDRISGF